MADFLSNMTLLEKLSEIVSYYSLNSNFNDPMYQYAQKAYYDLYDKIYKNFWIGNLSYAEYSVIDRSEILEYGTIPCFTPEKQAFVDSHLSCFLFQLPFFLEKIQFGYISLLLVIPIIAISIFGGIKESYRWHLLNQAIWDALICYDFICQKPTLIGWFWPHKWESSNTCIYNRLTPNSLVATSVTTIIRDVFRFSIYIPVCLLAFSRFVGIYFPTFYQKVFSKSWKTISFILIFNFVCILFICSGKIIFMMLTSNVGNGMLKCVEKFCPDGFINSTSTQRCYKNDEKFFQCVNGIAPPLWITSINNNKINHIFALSIFCAANVFAFLLLIKIVSQLRFQLKSKNRSFFDFDDKNCGRYWISMFYNVNYFRCQLYSI